MPRGLRGAALSELERIQLLVGVRVVKAHIVFPREELKAQTFLLSSPSLSKDPHQGRS